MKYICQVFLLILRISLFISKNIIKIKLQDQYTEKKETNQLFLNLTFDYLLPICSFWETSIFRLSPFLSQLPLDKQPELNSRFEMKTLTLKLNLFKTENPIIITFKTYAPDLDFNDNNLAECLVFPYEVMTPPFNSIIHQFYSTGLINSRKFILELNNDNKEQYLYLGDIPTNIKYKYNKAKKYILPQIPNSRHWVFDIKSFSFGNHFLKLNSTCFIDLIQKNVLIESKSFELILSEYFDEFIRSKHCWDIINE